MQRRRFLRVSSMTVLGAACNRLAARELAGAASPLPKFPDADPAWRKIWDEAIAVLAGNTQVLGAYDKPVLIEGPQYPGIWMECAPLEALVYTGLRAYLPYAAGAPAAAEIARHNHMAFFALQKEDGQLPCSIKNGGPGFAQIQMVVPIAATAWEVAQQSHDDELLATAYAACSRWDAWLRRYRDTRKTGLVEGFCLYDTGHDNSPRWAGIPNACPGKDARKCWPIATLPRLCPDLSATVYGARVALAAMADALGKTAERDRWMNDAEMLRQLIIQKLYSAEDAAFYDLDANNRFVRVRSDVMSRVLGEHVLKLAIPSDRRIFDAVWARQLHNPDAFWTRFPFPSIAWNDPAFVRPIPRNSWGGAAQALTALRAPRWMQHYGKHAELNHMMRQWLLAIRTNNVDAGQGGNFFQQMNPRTGEFTPEALGKYSPTALVYMDFIRRLSR